MSAVAQEVLKDRVEEFTDPPVGMQTFVWAIGGLSRIHRVPFEAKLLLEQFPPPYTLASLQQALEVLGMTVKFYPLNVSNLSSESFPCLLVYSRNEDKEPASEGNDPGESVPGLALAVRSDGERILYFESGSDTPHTEGVDEADRRFEPLASLTPSRAPGGKGHIEIQSLGFRYADDRPPLYRNLNLTIKPGTAVALTGPSGCGKSTLAKLLQGFYRPTEGRILIDGRDVYNLSANELRAHFGVVPQDTQLFSGTIYHNLIAANPHASFEQVVQACRLAEIHETVEGLPEGYQTALGERGVGLSGGQKQRLAIARALLKRPQILIFDEATSALDSETAEQFAQTVNKLRGKVTLLFITHLVPKGLVIDQRLSLRQGASK